jgi:site-specific recombinase XerD
MTWLVARYATKTINQELRVFHASLRFLQEREYHVPLALLRLPFLKEPDSLPRFLTDEEVARLQMDLEQRVTQAEKTAQRRNALMDRSTFYLMWHAGLRVSEVEELCLSNLNLGQRQISVRQGKGRKDRTVYLTDVTVKALKAYLAMRGQGRTEHLFVYRHKPLSKDLVRVRIKAAGQRTGVKVTPHQLRHTCATQLVNAGCQITTIQAMLGHRRLKSTMIYARVYDRTVAEDYYAAMTVIERRLEPHLRGLPETKNSQKQQAQTFSNGTNHLLALVDAMNNGSLSDDQQQILTQFRSGILALG